MRLLCVGVNHTTADVALREKLAIAGDMLPAALKDLADRWDEAQFAVVSTCNRTEVYVARTLHGHPREEDLTTWLADRADISENELIASVVVHADANAARHLLAVAAGLESQVVGESQIVAQLKAAYAAAQAAGTGGAELNTLFQTALQSAKDVRTETDIGAGRVSVASSAVDAVVRHVGSLEGLCVLNIGAGKMNDLMLQRLGELGAGEILVANRSPGKAAELAGQCGGTVVAFDALSEALARSDVVVASTAAPAPIITQAMAADVMEARGGKPLLIVDIAVPRDVEPAVGDIPGVTLLNIDDLGRDIARHEKNRHTQRVAAEAILAGHLAKVLRRLKIHQVVPTIDDLYRAMNTIAEEELQAARHKLSTHDDVDDDEAILRRALHRTVRRIMHPAAKALRQGGGSDSAADMAAMLRKVFGLDDPKRHDD